MRGMPEAVLPCSLSCVDFPLHFSGYCNNSYSEILFDDEREAATNTLPVEIPSGTVPYTCALHLCMYTSISLVSLVEPSGTYHVLDYFVPVHSI